MRVSVAIMAHPKRAGWARDVQARLDAPATIVWDRYDDIWDTGRRALLQADRHADRHVVLQDDALPCHDLTAGVAAMSDVVPAECPIGLYCGSRGRGSSYAILVRRARRNGASFVTARVSPLWGVGVALLASHIDEIIEHGDRMTVDHGAIYDGRLRRWYRQRNIDQYYPVPSLVEHRSAIEGEASLLGRGNSKSRTAFYFAGADASAVDFDWHAGSVGESWASMRQKHRRARA
jgi:hypothetical protein